MPQPSRGGNPRGRGPSPSHIAGPGTAHAHNPQGRYSRNMKSSFNTVPFNAYGGKPWARSLVCMGYVIKDVARSANCVIAERAREPRREPPTELAPGRLRGRDTASPPRVIKHIQSLVKQLGEGAKLEERTLMTRPEEWRRASSQRRRCGGQRCDNWRAQEFWM